MLNRSRKVLTHTVYRAISTFLSTVTVLPDSSDCSYDGGDISEGAGVYRLPSLGRVQPPIAQLEERETVDVADISTSPVQSRVGGLFSFNRTYSLLLFPADI